MSSFLGLCPCFLFFWKNFCIFVRVFILDNFSLVFKDVLFGFYSSHKNLKDYLLS